MRSGLPGAGRVRGGAAVFDAVRLGLLGVLMSRLSPVGR